MRALPSIPRRHHVLLATSFVNSFIPVAFAADASLRTSPVVVTATRIETNSFDLPISIDTMGGDVIRDAQPQVNLTETAVRIPGVVANNRFNGSQDLAISTRGFGARSAFGVRGVRLYADGIPLTMPDGQGQTGTFNLDTAKSIEFMRGPFSALYGNSSGGVVQIFTRDGDKDPTLAGGVTFGSYNTRRATATFEGQTGNLNYIANASDLSSDGYRYHSKQSKEMQHAKLSYAAGTATKVTFVATSLNQNGTDDPLALSQTEYRQNPQQAGSGAVANNTRVERNHTQAGLVADHTISAQNSLSAIGYYGVRDNRQYQFLPGPGGRVASIERNFGGLDVKWTHRSELVGRPFSLVAGVNYDRMEDARTQNDAVSGIMTTLKRDELQKVQNFDEYIQATFEPSERWLLVAGLRHTDIKFNIADRFPTGPNKSGSLKFSNTSPVLGVTFRLTPAINLYANYGTGFETPTFIEYTYSNFTLGTGPNLTLQPSTSKNYEVGLKAFVTDSTRINLALFKVATEKEVVTDRGSGASASFKNAGDTRRTGIELSLDSALPNNFNVYVAFTQMDAKFKDAFCTGTPPCVTVQEGNKIPGTYTSTGYAELSWQHLASGFSAAIEGIRFSDTFVNDTNLQKADGYTLLNFRAGFVQKMGGWNIKEFFRIENLNNKTYVSSVKVNANLGATTGAFYEPGTPRNWMLGFNASYRF